MSEPFWTPLGAAPPADAGAELAYQEFTANVSLTTAEAAPTPVVTLPQLSFDGNTAILLEFFCPGFTYPLQAATMGLSLWEAAAGDLGRLMTLSVDASARIAVNDGSPILARRFVPPAGAKTYSVRGWRTAGTFTVNAGPGGVGAQLPGYMRASRIPSGLPLPAGYVVPPQLVTSLPASPADGQEVYLTDSLTAPTYIWHLRYAAGRASNKWVALSGEVGDAIAAQEVFGVSGTYGNCPTVGPQVTVPVAGLYEIEHAAVHVGNGGWATYTSVAFGAAAAVDADGIYGGGDGRGWHRFFRRQLAAGTVVAMKYKADGSHSSSFADRALRVMPVAVGG